MFKNLRLYRVHTQWPDSEAAVSEKLAECAFKPCGTFSERSAGWEAPLDTLPDELCRRVGGADLLRLRVQSRILPPAAVTEALEERVEAFRQRAQREPGRKETRDLKEEVYGKLLPQAFLKSDRLWGFVLLSDGILGIDTASESSAERFLDTLRDAFGSLEVTPIAFQKPLGTLLTRIFLGEGPNTLQAGRECRMIDPAAGGASVNWLDIDLFDESVRKHVRQGLKLDRIAIHVGETTTCVLDNQCVVRKMRLVGIEHAEEVAIEAIDEDPAAILDSKFVMGSGAVRTLLVELQRHLGSYS